MPNSKRILIVQEDRLLGNFYREKLEGAGFLVDATRHREGALKLLSERRPDAVLLDPILPETDLSEMVASLRSTAAGRDTVIVVQPVVRPFLAEAALTAGAHSVLQRSVNPVAEIIDGVEGALSLERTAETSKSLPLYPDESWVKMSVDSLPETLNRMRRFLQTATRETGNLVPMRELLVAIHGVAEQMRVLGQSQFSPFTAAVESLVFDLQRSPSHTTASTCRTLGQAVDFLTLLASGNTSASQSDLRNARVLIVDDEDGARRIIMAAMQMVGLNATAAELPSVGLAALAAGPADLIFLDVGLPEMTGFELCAKVRALRHHEKTPIVFITGMATFQHRVQSSLSGGNDFVAKPFNISELGVKALLWTLRGQLGLL